MVVAIRTGPVNRSPRSVRRTGVDGSYLDRWASWVARWLVASVGGHGGFLVLVVDRGLRWPAAGVAPVCRGVDVAFGSAVTPYYGGVALAWAQGPSANLLTVSGGGRTALERSACVAQLVTRCLVEVGVAGGDAW